MQYARYPRIGVDPSSVMWSRLYAGDRARARHDQRSSASRSAVHSHGEEPPTMSLGVPQPDREFDRRVSARLLDVLIRAGLIAVLAMLCYSVFAPFLTLTVWAIILAITIYPLQQSLARKIGGRQGLAATIIVIIGGLLIVAPTALLMDSFGSSIHDFVVAVKDSTLEVPAPRESVRQWPIVGPKIYDFWSRAHTD